ncbi:ABC transporter permease, partial [Nonomuraea sp. NPDC050691]
MSKVKELPGEAVATAVRSPSISHSARAYIERVRAGDMGALPAVLGLVVLCTAFALARPAFLTAINFANLFTQGAAVTVIAMGLVFVLLIGEIDLSAGFTSGVCAAVLAVALTNMGLPWYVGVLAAIVTGAVIGMALGTLVAKVGIPSFVVTLAAFLAFQGLVLVLVNEGTNISINDPVIKAVAQRNLPPALGWALYAVCVLAYAGLQVLRARKRAA